MSAWNSIDLVGKTFGMLTVLAKLPTPIYRGRLGSSLWRVRCECGNEKSYPTCRVKIGKHCGCSPDVSYTKRSGITRRSQIPANERANKGHRRRKYGLSNDSFQAMIEKQGNCCAICKQVFTRTPHIDHDHSCCPGAKTCGKCIRGLLCHKCNTGLGNLRDSVDVLKSAIEYLQKG
jgi:hypothetical protein